MADMVAEKNENRLTMTVYRCYPVVFAALAFAISGCATTVGLGQAALREGRYGRTPSWGWGSRATRKGATARRQRTSAKR